VNAKSIYRVPQFPDFDGGMSNRFNWAPEAFRMFKEEYFGGGGGGGGADPFFSMPTTEMANEIPRKFWGHYEHKSEGTEVKVYARVVYVKVPGAHFKLDVASFGPGNLAVLVHPSKPGTPYPAKFGDADSGAPTVRIGTSQKQATLVEGYPDGEPPSDLSQIPIIMVVMVIVAAAFAFNK
jgi:hypothetical protein